MEEKNPTAACYSKADGFRKSEYGKYIEEKGYESVLNTMTMADFTSETVNKLIKEGQVDAWILLIQNDIKDMKLPPSSDKDIKHSLIDQLNKLSNSLKQKDFQNISDTYDEITAIIEYVNNKRELIDKLRTSQSDKIISSLEDFSLTCNDTSKTEEQ